MITTPRPVPIRTVVRARDLVHSNKIISGDWCPPEDSECSCMETDDMDYTHTCAESYTYAFLEHFETLYFSNEFIDSLLGGGILHPLEIEPMRYSGVMILRNGHHRLALAYKYDLMVPVRIGEWDYDESRKSFKTFEHLPGSTHYKAFPDEVHQYAHA